MRHPRKRLNQPAVRKRSSKALVVVSSSDMSRNGPITTDRAASNWERDADSPAMNGPIETEPGTTRQEGATQKEEFLRPAVHIRGVLSCWVSCSFTPDTWEGQVPSAWDKRSGGMPFLRPRQASDWTMSLVSKGSLDEPRVLASSGPCPKLDPAGANLHFPTTT
jgi:hypothetical protein